MSIELDFSELFESPPVFQFRNLKLGVEWTNTTQATVAELKKFLKYDPEIGLEFRTLTHAND